MNGRLTLSAKAIGTGRTGVANPIEHGVSIPGIDLTGLFFLAGIRIANLSQGTPTALNLVNLQVTENGATSTDEAVDFRGSAVYVEAIRLLIIVPDAANEDSFDVTSDVLSGTVDPGGVLLMVAPIGVTGSDLAQPMTFGPGGANLGCTVYVWG
jgi:hypothetical protein